jgi:hypothetical protein
MAPKESAQEWAQRMNTGDGSIGSLFRTTDYSVLNGQPVYSEKGGPWTTLRDKVVKERSTAKPTQAIPTALPSPVGTPGGLADAVQPDRSTANMSGPGGTNRGRRNGSALPSLKRGDDIPAAQYPDGVSTGVGGGNAAQAQSTDPQGSAYIPPTPAAPSTGNTGRSDTRTNSKGVTQTGTNTGIKPMTLADVEGKGGLFERLGLAGTRVQDPYSSNQLPTTSSNPDSGPNEQSMFDEATDKFRAAFQRGQTGGMGPTTSGQQKSSGFEEQTSAVKPNESSGQSKPMRGAVDSRFAEGAEYGETYTSDLSARSRAFLDAEDSMTGLRAAEATQGIVYAGGQHNILNPNRGKEGENDFIGITNKDDVRGYKSGRLNAQELLDRHMGEAKKTNAETSPEKSTLEQPSETAGPLADADAYGEHLKKQQGQYQMSGQGPVADADEYGAMLNNQPKNSGNIFARAQANIEQYRNR